MQRKRKILKVTTGEKILYFSAILALGFCLLLKIFCGANISNLKMDIETVHYEITQQEKKIESLTMQINEMTSFDTIKEIVKNMGLAYNNENIINVGD